MDLINIVLTFLISTLFFSNFFQLFTKSLDQTGKIWEQNLYFSLFNLTIGLGYALWLIKLLFLAGNTNLSQWIWFWKLELDLFFLSAVLIGKFGLNFIREKKITHIFNLSLIFVLFYIVGTIMIDKSSLNVGHFTTVSLKAVGLLACVLIILLILLLIFYFALSLTQLLFYLRENPDRSSKAYNKSKILIIGLFQIMVALIFRFTNLTINIGVLLTISDMIMFSGGIFFFYSLKINLNLVSENEEGYK